MMDLLNCRLLSFAVALDSLLPLYLGDTAQRIFVKACAWLCPFQESYLPRKVQCMKKSYMKGRKKRGLVLVGFLTQIHEIL